MAHHVSQTSFNANHANYDKFRAGYPEESVRAVIEACNITKDTKVLEVAAGTGKFTRELLKTVECDLEAVEPAQGMIDTFKVNFPSLSIRQGTASDLGVPSESVDVVIAAQAFHWFATKESLQEFHRVLRPGGVVCFLWNYEDFDALSTDSWQYRTVKLCHSYDKEVPQYNHMNWVNVLENQSFFEPYRETKLPYDKPVPSREFYWESWLTRSYITALPSEKLEAFHKEFEAIMDESIKPGETELVAKRGVHIVWAKRI